MNEKKKKETKIGKHFHPFLTLHVYCGETLEEWYVYVSILPSAAERNASTNIIIEMKYIQ